MVLFEKGKEEMIASINLGRHSYCQTWAGPFKKINRSDRARSSGGGALLEKEKSVLDTQKGV